MSQRPSMISVLQSPIKVNQQTQFQLLDRENQQLVKRLAVAMKSGHYPSPSDAKVVDELLNRSHLNRRRQKLEAEAVHMKHVQQENAQLLKMIAKVQREGGRVNSHWDELFIAGWNRRREKQSKARDDAERRSRQTSLTSDDERRRLRRVESDYSRERLRNSWTRNLQQIYSKAGAPESQWWTQYMLMATGETASARHADTAEDRWTRDKSRQARVDVAHLPSVRRLFSMPFIHQQSHAVAVRV